MTPPEAPNVGTDAAGDMPPAVSVCLTVLNKRADFLRAARAKRQGAPSMIVQGRERHPDETVVGIRVGYTCSKKVGNAVARNRAKRRLRAAARQVLPDHGKPGWDYVLIGRPEVTSSRPFAEMLSDLTSALENIHGGGRT
ncbi:MAG: ribonuclease P protein component [Paracoccaceae bacterium]